jgi:L-2-hydroxycarboxylate dehydrogenase (NAD+)
MQINIEEIKQLCTDVLLKLGLNKADAETVVNEYLYGELTGKKSHGFLAFPKFAAEKIKGRKGDWKVIKEDDTYALIDGNGNVGQLIGRFAMELAIRKAKEKGIALVGMNNMESYLMPGYYAEMASDKNMVGIVIDNSKSRIAPFGGIEPRLGANPIGLAIPTKDTPFVLDMATSVRTMGEVRLAKKLGKLLPEGLALNEEGNPARDPDRVNALLPFGGYKGYGLCLAIEILAGSFVRAKMGGKIKSGLDRGYLFLVIDPGIFVNIETFKEEISELIKEVKSSKKAKDVEEILTPGEHAEQLRRENLAKGYLDIDDKIIEDIKNLL